MISHIWSLEKLISEHLDCSEPIQGAEIGVWEGQLSAHVMRKIPAVRMLMVDPWETLLDRSYENTKGNVWTPEFMAKRMALLVEGRLKAEAVRDKYADRARILQMTSVEAAKLIAKESLDFAFVDDNHRYEAVKASVKAWMPKVRSGGIVAGHDYSSRHDQKGFWGVKKAIDELAEWYEYEVGRLPGYVWWWIKR